MAPSQGRVQTYQQTIIIDIRYYRFFLPRKPQEIFSTQIMQN